MRRRKGQPVHGWIIVDKPAGVGSTTVVNRLRHALGAQKAGHAGTLDPDATGVLAVAFGEATKTIPFVMDATKDYSYCIRWGAETTTDDAAGRVTATAAARPDRPAILAALPAQAFLIALDERGRQPTTVELSAQLAHWMQEGAQPCFVIGGADGLDASIKTKSDLLLGISRLTLPHGLVRVLLAEQLYRATSLLKGHPYHRE